MMTNGDRIRQMSDEELAGLHLIGRLFCNVVRCEEHQGDCKKCSLEWLLEDSQSHEET